MPSPRCKDAALIAAAQKVEHYEIAAYGCVCTYAEMLGYDQVHELLGRNLDEEETTDQRLTALAESVINPEAGRGLVLRRKRGPRPSYARPCRDPGPGRRARRSSPGPARGPSANLTRISRTEATTASPSTSPHQSPTGPSPSRNPSR